MEVDNNDNSDEDYEEEEFLVFLDFQSKIKSETLEKRNLKIKMIGFETDEPIVQVNNKIFRGTFEHAMGTNVFFTPDPDPPSMDPNFEPIPSTMYKYHSQTDKVLRMERMFITPKQENDELTETQSDEDVVPTESYSDALNHFLKLDELPPRTLTGSDVLKPSEFHDFFRPQLNNEDEDEPQNASETVMDATETNDNEDRAESNLSEVDDGGDDGKSTETTSPMKVETIKQEKQ
ncbi:uncharacterized protein LOC119074897 [Bradysia coprophila]|uniref:uncharacterized protein LOC119074897 n=1 Tax=Bradysia coprophila TaxID=38358 RepID=UPI00187D8B21|nr:uncharacterized protein LOC119074897 [Bradysia coprophila]